MAGKPDRFCPLLTIAQDSRKGDDAIAADLYRHPQLARTAPFEEPPTTESVFDQRAEPIRIL
ncbi:MAG TPA: hypothetical protein VN494_06480 [Patescibacteria group bacterium]|nr:hypothetical protein [Patescibacteria group bacterium]